MQKFWGVVITLLFISAICWTVTGECKQFADSASKEAQATSASSDTGWEVQKKQSFSGNKTETEKAFNRVKSRETRGTFSIIGHMVDRDFGFGTHAAFRYTGTVVATSKIVTNKKFPNGNCKIEEVRSFYIAEENLDVSDVDFELCLGSLPGGEYAYLVAILAKMGNVPVLPELIAFLKKIDGKPIKKTLDELWPNCHLSDIKIKPLEDLIKKQIGKWKVKSIIGKNLHEIENQEYKISWFQDTKGNPLMMVVKNANGKRLSDIEQKILHRLNLFIDYNMVPNTDYKPGDKWTVDARDMEEVLDPFVDGNYSGQVRVMRTVNDPNDPPKTWNLELQKSFLAITSDNGETHGKVLLEGGFAKVSPDYSVQDLYVHGQLDGVQVSEHHMLFKKTIQGKCQFEGRLISLPLEENDSKENNK